MPGTLSRVLTGVATLQVGAPVGSRAEWSDEQAYTGSHSVKLSKLDGGNYGSTSVLFTPTGAAAALTISEFVAQAGVWGWDYFRVGPAGTYWEQMECRFEDPLSDSWVDITVQVDVAALGEESWQTKDLADSDTCYYGGWSELDGSFSNFAAGTIALVTDGTHLTAAAPVGPSAQIADTGVVTGWVLTRVRMELWETSTVHYVYIDDIVLEDQTFTLEPGNATAAVLLGAPFTDIGYTDDGVDMTYTGESANIAVEEETFPIDNVLVSEAVEITCNMAEASLFNMDKAMGGSLLSGSILKLGAGVQKKITLQLLGVNPAGFNRAILIPSCVAVGPVGMPYKKETKTVVPVTFRALKTAGHPAVTIVDNAA